MKSHTQSGTGVSAGLGGGKLRRCLREEGFSLLELVVAMALFLIVGGTALTLFSRHEALLGQEQGMAGLNIGLRNALAQIQVDAVNAGSGTTPGSTYVASWPVGVTIVNSNPNASPPCTPATTGTYTVNCFDQLNVVMVDPNTPPLQLLSSYGTPAQNTCLNTSNETCNTTTPTVLGTEGTMSVTGSLPTGYSSGTYYSHFQTNDQVLFVDVSSSAQSFTVATLTQNGSNASPNVQLTFQTTQPQGYNYGATAGNDPLGMTTPFCYVNTTAGSSTITWNTGNYFVADSANGVSWDNQQILICNPSGSSANSCNSYTVSTVPSSTSLTVTSAATPATTLTKAAFFFYSANSTTNQFYSGDFVLRLLPIQYTLNVSNPSDPQLVRKQGTVSSVVMDQVIGFKVGAAWWNSPPTGSDFLYDYNSSDYGNNFSLVRAVRISIIGRTTPSTDPTYTYVNSFDGGRYQIRGSSIVVNPRNLTMSND